MYIARRMFFFTIGAVLSILLREYGGEAIRTVIDALILTTLIFVLYHNWKHRNTEKESE